MLRSSEARERMPKKTKKEKIIAEYRRKLQTVSGNPAPKVETYQSVVSEKSPNSSSIQPTYQLNTQQTVSEQRTSQTSAIDLHDLIAIRHDLIKTILLAAATISVELLLYWRIGK